MVDQVSAPLYVKAIYNFRPNNTDELTFSKGDIITVTQCVDGGWWEGTLLDKTGWFPSNYVKETRLSDIQSKKKPVDHMSKHESMLYYHNVVLQSLIETERQLVRDLQIVLRKYLLPMRGTNVLTELEHLQLVGNLEDLSQCHERLLVSLEECAKLPIAKQQVGGIFIEIAPSMKALYHAYCANHPRAVSVLQRKRDELTMYIDSQGAVESGSMMLTTCLSRPLTRLNKYPSLLKEFERHTDESHIDRGDTQRAISVYKEIAVSCNEIRKRKEMEHEILNSSIRGWQGQDMCELGEVILMSNIELHHEDGLKEERILLLFSSHLVILSVSPRLSGYIFEGKFPISGMSVHSVENSESYENAFEITGSTADRCVISCATPSECHQWIESIRQQSKLSQYTVQPPSLQLSNVGPAVSLTHTDQSKTRLIQLSPWSLSCLRPAPPLRPAFSSKEDMTKSPRGLRKGSFRKRMDRAPSEEDHLMHHKKLDETRSLEDDSLLLKVIEAYCTSTKARQTVNSSILDHPEILVAEHEKMIVEEVVGNAVVFKEQTLVDTVYALKDEIKEMQKAMKFLRQQLEEEKKHRLKLEGFLAHKTSPDRISSPLPGFLVSKEYNNNA